MPDLDRSSWRRWLSVIAVGWLLVLVEGVMFFLDLHWRIELASHLLMMGILTAGASLFSSFIFAMSRKREQEILEQNQELERRVQERTTELLEANEALQAGLISRRRAEQALRENRAQLAGIIGSAMDAVITIDADQRIILFNAAAEQMFRCPAAEAMGQPIDRFIPERARQAHRDFVRSFGQTNVTQRRMGRLGAVAGLRADGEEFPAEVAISKVEVAGQALYAAIIRDITERTQAEEQLRRSHEELRALAAHLQSAREEERSRIAREIHDELGQTLTGLTIDLSWLASRLPDDRTALREKTSAMSALIASTIQAVRRISTELRPGVLDDLGLRAAIEWQAQEFQARTGIGCRLTSNLADLDVDRELSTAVFRICQETLTNVARHAGATRVDISLKADAGRLILAVKDDGTGITEREIADAKSLGLVGMRERALLLGGEFSIVGRSGKGTTVAVGIPYGRTVSGNTARLRMSGGTP